MYRKSTNRTKVLRRQTNFEFHLPDFFFFLKTRKVDIFAKVGVFYTDIKSTEEGTDTGSIFLRRRQIVWKLALKAFGLLFGTIVGLLIVIFRLSCVSKIFVYDTNANNDTGLSWFNFSDLKPLFSCDCFSLT